MKKSIASILLALTLTGPIFARVPPPSPSFQEALKSTAAMVGDPQAQAAAQAFGLNFVKITWEDTGRFHNSSVGPNISDMSLQVQSSDPDSDRLKLTLLPVLRYPNFSDTTADLRLDKLQLLVGNEKNKALHKVSLRQYLANPKRYMTSPKSWKGTLDAHLLAPRDTHALVSAQACFLPVPKAGKVEFNPVLFNYQSTKGNPAVLTILATREGTSMTVIDNARDPYEAGATWGQRLYFNHGGQRASLTGERLSDFKAKNDTKKNPSVTVSDEEGLNMVLLIQVPLKHKTPERKAGILYEAAAPAPAASVQRSDMETAVIGHGELKGPFTEVDNLAIERDPRFPVRVTVQFYQATATGKISQSQIHALKKQIDRVYADGDYVGSLVVGRQDKRPTEYDGSKTEPSDWWETFWKTQEPYLKERGWKLPAQGSEEE